MRHDDMPRYRGTKELFAKPMTRGDYNAYRGWPAPEGEDQTVPGYLVEYTDGGEANHPDHEGYISWTPADVFVRAYSSCETFKDRLAIQGDELEDRVGKLSGFIGTTNFEKLPVEQQYLLRGQLGLMRAYSSVLEARISLIA
jgi:hypothetical protein